MITSLEPTYEGTAESGNMGLNTTSAMTNQFLTLLLAQLQNQDPMNPMEAREFTSQLTQLSLLEQTIHTNQSLDTLNLYQESANNTRAVSLIGKEVLARADTVYMGGEGGGTMRFSLDVPTATTDVFVYDSLGRLVRSASLGPKGAGEHSWVWDGRNQMGQLVPQGTYTLEVVGKDAYGDTINPELTMQGRVQAVQFRDGDTTLMVSGVPISLGDILEVRE
jgi:flagellar basal-body rod modification protein FlgD